MRGCNDTTPCSDGRVCSTTGAMGDGSCVADCTNDPTCPAGLKCQSLPAPGKKGCLPEGMGNPLNGPCTNDFDCAAAGAAIKCTLGVCAIACNDSTPCAAGTVCSVKSGAGVCLADCSAAQACGQGLQCADLWYGAQRGCMGMGKATSACRSVTAYAPCPSVGSVCGTSVDNGQQCANGTFCPKGSSCAPNNTCNGCGGNATNTTCEGQPCTGAACMSNDWWCAPKQTTVSCGDDPSHFLVACNCADGTQVFSNCGWAESCEARCAQSCDPVAQDCKDPSKPKCTHVFTSDNQLTRFACVSDVGTVDENQPCQRSGGTAGAGHDNCKPGLYCTSLYSGDGSYVCKRICAQQADCKDPSSACIRYDDVMSLCAPKCTLFGNDCPQGTVCKWASGTTSGSNLAVGYCSVNSGMQQYNQVCVLDADCAGTMTCNGLGRCLVPCDATHACPAGMGSKCGINTGQSVGLCTP